MSMVGLLRVSVLTPHSWGCHQLALLPVMAVGLLNTPKVREWTELPFLPDWLERTVPGTSSSWGVCVSVVFHSAEGELGF